MDKQLAKRVFLCCCGFLLVIAMMASVLPSAYTSVDGYFKDVEKMNDIIEKQTGKRTKILRFPGGVSNTVSRKYASKIMSKLAKKVEEHGYHYYDWNASNGDGNCYTSVDSLINTGLKEVRNQDTVMMLMHDGGANKATVEALPTLLNSYIQQGFEFRIIDDTTPVFHHHIAN